MSPAPPDLPPAPSPVSAPTPAPAPAQLEPFAFAPLLLALANAAGPGLALWAWTRADRSALLLDNQLPAGESPWAALGWAAASALGYALVCALAWALGSRRAQPETRGAVLRRLGLLLSPLAASMLLPLIYVPELPAARRLLVALAIAGIAASFALTFHTAWPWLRARWPTRGWTAATLSSPRLPAALLALLCVGAAARLSQLALIRHRALGSRIYDLGIFDNLMFHAAQGEWQVTSVLKNGTFTSAHCAPILQLLAPIYALAPGPETLMLMQASWLASGAIPVYLLGETLLDAQLTGRRWIALSFALAWLCHPSLHGVALFDFHALTLAAPMIPWAAYALVRGHLPLWIVSVSGLLLTREDLPFVVLALALFAWSFGRRRWAALTALAALATLAVVKLALMEHPDLFMPDSESSYRYANRFSKVIPNPEEGGASDILATALSNPAFVLQHAISPSKMIYLTMLTLPTLGLALLGREALWLASFGLVFTALGSGSNLHHPYLHYTVFLFPALAVAALFGLRRLGERIAPDARARNLGAVALAVAIAAPLAGDRFGALHDSQAFRAGSAPLIRTLDAQARERYAWVRAAVAQIPADAAVSATNALGPHASRRAELYSYRHHKHADWLLLATGELSTKDRRELRQREASGELERVSAWGGELLLLRRAL